jgi:hypothetical protein
MGKALPIKRRRTKRTLDAIKAISPAAFENLVFDLVVLKGITNAKWRTPGADTGRDIEGETAARDFSGHSQIDRWCIECKRYAHAIDWPTAHMKLAYAHNLGFDYLLFVTTSGLSPACRDQVATWNSSQRRPLVRDWSGAELETLVNREPLLIAKYVRTSASLERRAASLPLLSMVSKATQQIYGESILLGVTSAATEFAACAAEFATGWVEARTPDGNPLRSRLIVDRDIPSWCEIRQSEGIERWAPQALRALLASIKMLSDASRLQLSFQKQTAGLRLRIRLIDGGLNERLTRAGLLVCSMADWEWSLVSGELQILQRAR